MFFVAIDKLYNLNAALSGKKLLAKISEERTKANCFLSIL
jgi:hypothetical protein